MSEEVRIVLNVDDSDATVLESAPEGVHDMDYEMSRSEKYWGIFPVFAGRLGFGGDGKTFIDDEVDTNGKESIITIDSSFKLLSPHLL